MTSRLFLLFVLAFTFGCAPENEPLAWSDAWLLARGERFLDDDAYRREKALESLHTKDNVYSSQRVAHYAHGDRGWDALPAWSPRSRPLRVDDTQKLSEQDRFWDGTRPTSMKEWQALGKLVFERYPLRADVFSQDVLSEPEVSASHGLPIESDGSVPGLVRFIDVDGSQQVGLTCAFCHSEKRDGKWVLGAARRSLRYGDIRIRYYDNHNLPLDEELRQDFERWGAGRADISEDEAMPVAIPDLWGLQEQSALTHAGTITQDGPEALATRQETQLIDSNRGRVRPPRELAWAMAMYLYSLEPPKPAETNRDESKVEHGMRVFDAKCISCHSNAVYGGDLVDVRVIGTEASLANGNGRGTGYYRPSALLDLTNAAPYLHDGSVATLEDLFSRRRLEITYEGVHAVGAVPGHEYGLDLNHDDKEALIAFLRTL